MNCFFKLTLVGFLLFPFIACQKQNSKSNPINDHLHKPTETNNEYSLSEFENDSDELTIYEHSLLDVGLKFEKTSFQYRWDRFYEMKFLEQHPEISIQDQVDELIKFQSVILSFLEKYDGEFIVVLDDGTKSYRNLKEEFKSELEQKLELILHTIDVAKR